MTSTPRILLVDDDTALLRLLEMRLQASGYEISCADSGEQALEQIRQHSFDLVLTDLRMDGMDGLTLFSHIRQEQPDLPVIIITAQGSLPEAVEATQKGVFGFLSKPIDEDHLLDTVRAALHSSQRQRDQSWRAGIISHSARMEQVLDQAQRVAASDVSVLITGPSGSGKKLVARAIHQASSRADKPFIALNCGALPEQLLESELFGHAKGAFSGAVNQHDGLLLAAQGGTLFLDEISDMPLALQAKLLRVLQDRAVRPVGSTQSMPVDVRIISATHHDLEAAMLSREFREDLYYRLNVVNLELPPLRERPEDIPLLARHFLTQAAAKHHRKVRGISPGALHLLAQAAWPGNVRQLKNVMEQVVALSPSPIIPEGLVSKALTNQERVIPSFNEARADFERRYLIKVLQITEGNVTHAARIAQRNRTDFYKLLNKHQLEAAQFKADAKAALAAQQEALKAVTGQRKVG
jgi:two-component system response regulator GlrR